MLVVATWVLPAIFPLSQQSSRACTATRTWGCALLRMPHELHAASNDAWASSNSLHVELQQPGCSRATMLCRRFRQLPLIPMLIALSGLSLKYPKLFELHATRREPGVKTGRPPYAMKWPGICKLQRCCALCFLSMDSHESTSCLSVSI